MLNVIFVIPSLRGGGAERVISILIRYLDRSRFQLTLIVVDMQGAVFDKDIPQDVRLIDLNLRRVRYSLPKIIALIRKLKPDILFSTMWYLNMGLAICHFLLPRNTCHIARETSIVSQRILHSRFPIIWQLMYRMFYKKIPNIICQSWAMKEDLVSNYNIGEHKTTVIHNPVDVDRIRFLRKCTTPLDVDPWFANKTILVAAGRLSKAKGFDILLDAFSKIDNANVCLVIMGIGELKTQLERQTIKLGLMPKVRYIGFQENPYPWLAGASAFVLSSRYEGFPNVVVEALACGTPIIATPAPGGTLEILNGVEGCMVADEVSANALAHAITKWLSAPRVPIPSDAIEKYKIENIIDLYDKMFVSQVNGGCN
jgi:glycosyltransferase involved in cell wall biosynthesis